MNSKTLFSLLALAMLIGAKNPELPTVENVDLTQYSGTWYEIAKLPNRFEKGLECITANYTLKENGKIEVRNGGVKTKNGKVQDIKGTAWVPNSEYPGILKVRFFWPFSGDYYILDLDDTYHYSLVGSPSRDYLWILCRTPEMDPETYQLLLDKAQNLGFDTSKIEKVNQDCPN